jgi:small-conductance mechanosensitive channel
VTRILEALDFPLFTFADGGVITVGSVAVFLVILTLSFVVSRAVQRVMVQAMRRGGGFDEGSISTARRLTHYLIILIGAGVALQMIGVSLTAVFAAGAVVAVGVGFALQNILQNFVSGVILLAERSITENDVLEVDGQMILIQRIGARTTVARTREDEELIIPNSILVQSTVTNYTLSDSAYRIRAKVGVAYGTDEDLAERALVRAGESVPSRLESRAPAVLLLEFGDSSVVWEVSVWAEDPWQAKATRSDLNKAIARVFREEGITIAFPQLDVHFPEGAPARS